MKFTPKQNEIIAAYVKLASKNKRYPTRGDMIGAGVSRDRIRDHFGTLETLKACAKKVEPKKLEVLDKKKTPHQLIEFTKEKLGSIIKDNDYKTGTFFVTAASPTTPLDWTPEDFIKAEAGGEVLAFNLFEPGFKAVQTFLKTEKAELVILPMPAHVKALQEQPLHYDPKLKPFLGNFATEFTFNEHLKAIEAHLNPQQINPLTGLRRLRVHRFTSEGGTGEEITLKRLKTSIIVAHSKQMMETVPTGNESHPRIIHSTGTITKPSYLRNRIGMIANEDHKLGGLIIEIEDGYFWIRQVQFNPKNGSFIDMGKRYHADGRVTEERAEAFKMGDCHPGFHDPVALEATYKLWDIIKPKRIFLEDFFDGASISHHTANKKITKAMLPAYFQTLPAEIAMAREVLGELYKKAPKDAQIIATASNHPEHVGRYLDEGRYMKDCSENFKIGHQMVVMRLEGKNPLKEFLDPEKKMMWTNENDDFWVENCQFGAHGHLGIAGARGSKISHELSYSSSMTGHSHSPSIYHDAFIVGHTSVDRHGYNNGSQNWILCSGAIYKGGHKQLYFIVNGSSFRPKSKKK